MKNYEEMTYLNYEPPDTVLATIERIIEKKYTLEDIATLHTQEFLPRLTEDPTAAIKTAMKLLAHLHLYATKLHHEKKQSPST